MYQEQRRRLKKKWPELWFPDPKHVLLAMHLADNDKKRAPVLELAPSSVDGGDRTSLLSDEILLGILSSLPASQRGPASLVCRRWHRLLAGFRSSLVVRDWSSLHGLPNRFPNLSDLDLVPAAFAPPLVPAPGVLLTRANVSIPIDIHSGSQILPDDDIHAGLQTLSLFSLTRLALVAPASSHAGLQSIASQCVTLQQLELHRCTDLTLRSISAFRNLQILKLVGSVEGIYTGPGVSDIGLTILARECKRLVKLELARCEGSYDGISAVGRCCLMLEELTFHDHRMDAGWTAGLAFCSNLKTLRLVACRHIDLDPWPEEHLGECPVIERLQMQRCHVRDKRSLGALFIVCQGVRELMFLDCWGLDKDMFAMARICRRVKLLSLEGCSQLTAEGLEWVILSWKDLQGLIVVSCNNIKDNEITPALSNLFSVLKEFKWRPDTKSVLAAGLAGSGMGKKGGRFFKRK